MRLKTTHFNIFNVLPTYASLILVRQLEESIPVRSLFPTTSKLLRLLNESVTY